MSTKNHIHPQISVYPGAPGQITADIAINAPFTIHYILNPNNYMLILAEKPCISAEIWYNALQHRGRHSKPTRRQNKCRSEAEIRSLPRRAGDSSGEDPSKNHKVLFTKLRTKD